MPALAPARRPSNNTYLWPSIVDPANVSTFLWGRNSHHEPVHQGPPGFRIDTGVRITTISECHWLVTQAGFRYSLDYLKVDD